MSSASTGSSIFKLNLLKDCTHNHDYNEGYPQSEYEPDSPSQFLNRIDKIPNSNKTDPKNDYNPRQSGGNGELDKTYRNGHNKKGRYQDRKYPQGIKSRGGANVETPKRAKSFQNQLPNQNNAQHNYKGNLNSNIRGQNSRSQSRQNAGHFDPYIPNSSQTPSSPKQIEPIEFTPKKN